MKAFAVREKRARPAARRAQGPVTRPWTPALRAQRTEIHHILHGQRLQAKLKIGAPDDAYEREADRVADQVMRMPEPETVDEIPVLQRAEDTAIQRLCTECEDEVRRQPVEEEKEEEFVQAKASPGATPEFTPDLASRILTLRGGGQPLPESARAFFEPRFGHDFGAVRVHSDARAAAAAKSVNARAFTLGHSIAFAPGEYAPETNAGRRLLAHELTHVLQQRGSGLGEAKSVRYNESDSQAEHGADAVAETIRGSGRAPASVAQFVSARLQRATITDCNTADKKDASTAVADAVAAINTTIKKIQNVATPPAALSTYFGNSGPSQAQDIADYLTTIANNLPNATLECEYPTHWFYNQFCSPGAIGYVRGAGVLGGFAIHLCQPLFGNLTAKERATTVVHEGAHRYLWFVYDKAYYTLSCAQTTDTRAMSDAQRLANADCYGCLVHTLG